MTEGNPLLNTEVAFASKGDKKLKGTYRLFRLLSKPALVALGKNTTNWLMKMGLPIAPLVKPIIYDHFCGGSGIDDCKEIAIELNRCGVPTLVNYGVEASDSETNFDATLSENLKAIEVCATEESMRAVCVKITGFGPFDLFEKVQRGVSLSEEETAAFDRAKNRLDQLAARAASTDVALYIDAEESWIQDVLDDMVNALMSTYNTTRPVVYNTFQIYRHDRYQKLSEDIETARNAGYFLGAKLVRGAYMEKERKRAQKMGYESPIHANKQAVNIDYHKAIDLVLENLETTAMCIATHNEDSCSYAAERIDAMSIQRKHPHIYFSQLYGMGEHITFNLANMGFNATKYIPYGPVKEVIPYLMRRADENSSVEGQMGRELTMLKTEMTRRNLL